ncbi:MAG: reverse transcriptase family protein [Proteobacteria bacterium]|nr:reverse transcriptase family protein [Pseudomonadota bacterium]
MSRSRRQELYDRIRRTSRDEFILDEMIRLGFWPESHGKPGDPAEEIRRRGELERRLWALRSESKRLHNIEALKREARRRRLAESRRKQEETKERRLRRRAERAQRWKERKERDIVYLGAGVSGGLSDTDGDGDKLASASLPTCTTAAELARAMDIGVGELRYLAFSRNASRITHYVRFTIAKRTGGKRLISAPMPRLKAAQRWILARILDPLEPHDAAHGFRTGRSIVSNAHPHVGKDVVVNADLENFFPTVTYRRVKGLFVHIGYSQAVATILALLCTEPEVAEPELDDETHYVALGQRFLPQGAPTSPAISNLLCRRMDRRLYKSSRSLGFTYTRYADDLTFSGSGEAAGRVGRLLRQVAWIAGQEGFALHAKKTRVLRRSRRQEVTGIVVNQRPAIARDTLRRFRATLFQIEKDGPEGKYWGEKPRDGTDVITSVLGFASYVAMVQPDRGVDLLRRAKKLAEIYGRRVPPRGGRIDRRQGAATRPARDRKARESSRDSEPNGDRPEGSGKRKKWWKIF